MLNNVWELETWLAVLCIGKSIGVYGVISFLSTWPLAVLNHKVCGRFQIGYKEKAKSTYRAKRYVYFYPINEDKSRFKYGTELEPIDNESGFCTTMWVYRHVNADFVLV